MELSKVQSCLEDLSPAVEQQEKTINQILLDRASDKGSLRVIIWMNGVVIILVTGLIIALFSWGLNHITLKAEFSKQPATSMDSEVLNDVHSEVSK